MRRVVRISVIVLLVMAILGNAGLLAGILVTKEPAARPLTADRVEKATRPALVLIQSNYTVSTSIPSLTIDQASTNYLLGQIQQMINSGQIYQQDQVEPAAINLILSSPDTYFSPGTPITSTFDQVATGSGFFVTQDGYLVTAAHVVSADKSEIRSEALNMTKDAQFVADARKSIANDFHSYNLNITDAQIDSMLGFYQRWAAKYLSIDKVDVKYYLGTGTVQTGDSLVAAGVRASVVSIDPTAGGHDIAIMKAEVTGVPTLQLATGAAHLGDTTYAIGYPRQGYLDEAAPLNQAIPATMTTGNVLLVDPRPGGWSAWGTTAQFTHGDSGGPVVGGDGKVLGLVSYSQVDAQGKQLPGGGFFVPSQYIGEDLAGQGVKPVSRTDDLTPTYYHALAEGDIQRYKTELLLLEDIQARSPFDAYVKSDISSIQSQILSGNDKTPPDLVAYVPAAAQASGGVIALAVVLWIAMAIAGRRRRPHVETAPAAPAVDAPPALTSVSAPVEPVTDEVISPAEVMPEREPIAERPALRAPSEEQPPEPRDTTPS